MNCPHCGTPNLRTVETFQQPEKTYRTKKCGSCRYTFTSHETLADEVTIPKVVRMANRSPAHRLPPKTRPTRT